MPLMVYSAILLLTIIRVVTDSSIYISRSVSIERMQNNYCAYYVNTAAILKIYLYSRKYKNVRQP